MAVNVADIRVRRTSCVVLRWGGCCRCSSKFFPGGLSERGRSLSCEVRCRWSVCWTEASDGEIRSSVRGTDTEGGSPPEHAKNKDQEPEPRPASASINPQAVQVV